MVGVILSKSKQTISDYKRIDLSKLFGQDFSIDCRHLDSKYRKELENIRDISVVDFSSIVICKFQDKKDVPGSVHRKVRIIDPHGKILKKLKIPRYLIGLAATELIEK